MLISRLLNVQGLTPDETSVLGKLFPNKGKPLPAQLDASFRVARPKRSVGVGRKY